MWLCLTCSQTIEPGEYKACPHCGDSKGVPANLDEMVTITLTKLELRILTIWSEQWATAMKDEAERERGRKVIYGICDRLELQTPKSGPLTMAGEISEIRSVYPTMETNFPSPPE